MEDVAKQILDNLGLATVLIDDTGRIEFANAAFHALCGYSAKEVEGLAIDEVVEGKNVTEISGWLPADETSALVTDLTIRHRSGDAVAVGIHVTRWQTTGGQTRLTLMVRNMTQDVLRAQQAQDTLERLTAALVGAGVGVFDINVPTGTSKVSETWRRLMEFDAAETSDGQAEWLARIHPEDLPKVKAADEACLEGRTENSIMDYRMRSLDGQSWRWMRSEAVAERRDENGRATRLIGTQTDITERKRVRDALKASEEQFRSAMMNAPIGKALIATDGTLILSNPAFGRFFGYSDDALHSLDLETLTHPDDRQADRALFEQLMSGVITSKTREKRYMHADGSTLWGYSSLALVRDQDNEPVHLISQILDITEQRNLDQMKRNFIATVSHELRTPVTSILGSLDLLKKTQSAEVSERDQTLIDLAHGNAQRLRVLIDDILDTEQLNTGQLQLHPISCQIGGVVEKSVSLARDFADRFGVTISYSARGANVTCRVDPARLEQVMTNLLSNAAKFSDPGGEVRVTLSSDGSRATVRVADDGRGISPEFQNAVFQPFSQERTPATRDRVGSGLGLNIVQKLVELMQGDIRFESAKGQGTTFWISLPLESANSDDA